LLRTDNINGIKIKINPRGLKIIKEITELIISKGFIKKRTKIK
jgi:hypothetical protein